MSKNYIILIVIVLIIGGTIFAAWKFNLKPFFNDSTKTDNSNAAGGKANENKPENTSQQLVIKSGATAKNVLGSLTIKNEGVAIKTEGAELGRVYVVRLTINDTDGLLLSLAEQSGTVDEPVKELNGYRFTLQQAQGLGADQQAVILVEKI
ncbi:MAG: hypothetical protein PHH01_02150 [Patescibacteria group bacterium]|nr:hypothetical protein [Patescibacteria group bacterium]